MIETLLEQPKPRQEHHFDELASRYYDTATEAAEGLNGMMHTVIPLAYDGDDVYSVKDGTRLKSMICKGLGSAYVAAMKNPNLGFLLERTIVESDEVRIVREMASGKGPNTLIVTSDFPHELMGATEDIEGFNHERKQTMQRLIMRRDNGQLLMITQTLDGSDRHALGKVYELFGEELQEGQALGQRIQRDLTEEEQDRLCPIIIDAYDAGMKEKHGGEWSAGRKLDEGEARINTYDFVRAQEDILIPYINSEVYGQPEAKKGFMKIMTERFLAAKQQKFDAQLWPAFADGDDPVDEAFLYTADFIPENVLRSQLFAAAFRADIEGFVFTACGGTIKSHAKEVSFNPHDALKNAGYAQPEPAEAYSWDGGESHQGECVNCHEGPKEVGVKDWCQDCIEGHCG